MFYIPLSNAMVQEKSRMLGTSNIRGVFVVYYLHEEGELQGVVLTHVDDLILARSAEFIEKIRARIADVFTVSKVGGGDNSSKLEFQEWHLGADSLGDFKVFCFFRKKIG